MQARQETRIHKLEQGVKQVFAAALDKTEGKITTKQLKRTADRATWNTTRLLDDYYIPTRDLKLKGVDALFTETGNPGHRFLAEPSLMWMKSRHYIPLTRTFERLLNAIRLHEPNNITIRRTRLDVLLNHVFDRVNEAINNSLTLQSDVEFIFEGVPRAGKKYGIYGAPYYSLWYGPVEDFSTNFIVVHTETPGYFDEATVHAYMGMVHKARKCRGKKDCVVYGLATDSKDFWFYQVNNESMWSHTYLEPAHEYFYEDIGCLLAFIFHEAHKLSQKSTKRKKPNKYPFSQLKIRQLPHPDTHEDSYERLRGLSPEGLDTWIN
ncbi:hypothetical protein N7504_000447 [Penicillium tannophilum]|nr:hypothetical protein N7504_000447 [Penicillium tannophilum]